MQITRGRRKCREPLESRFRRLKAYYAKNPPQSNLGFKFAVIDCSFRNGLTDAQTAEVLDMDEKRIEWEVMIILQNAQ